MNLPFITYCTDQLHDLYRLCLQIQARIKAISSCNSSVQRWCLINVLLQTHTKKNWVRERTTPTERPPFVGEVSAVFADRGCHVVSVTDPYGRILGFPDRSCSFFFRVDTQLYSRGCVDPVPDTLLLRKSGSAGNRTPTSGSIARDCDYYTTNRTEFASQFLVSTKSTAHSVKKGQVKISGLYL
jgi:hypothetical protein